ncbi:MAG: hypothetical protein JST26_19165 [Bacteroidetes bacterium]|nr:hypothetical protein [Bacteroidota bacterium]
MRQYFILFFSLLSLIPATVLSQKKEEADIVAKIFVDKNKILLRWVPANKETFELGKKYGYTVDRIQLGELFTPKDTGSAFGIATKITTAPLLPMAENDKTWLSLMKKEPNTVLVYQALYKKNKGTDQDPKERTKAEEAAFGMVLLSCDLSLDLAKATGLYAEDTDISKNSFYCYRIWIKTKNGEKYKPCLISVSSDELTKLKTISDLKGKTGNKAVKLTWNVSENQSDYAAYYFERCTDSIHFERSNKVPYIHLTSQYNPDLKEGVYSDSLPLNNVYYFYRVRGISHFGIHGPPSNIIKCIGKSGFNTYPYIDSVTTIKNKTIDIHFHLPNYDLKKLAGFQVIRSGKIDGTYENLTPNLLPANTKVFTDKKPLMANYYKIIAVNNERDSSASHPALGQLADEEPPAVPTGLSGKIDSTGKVMLTWNKNTEKDLKGYRLYKMNTLKEEPVEITTKFITQTSYVDSITLSTLTEDIYYTINAVDNTFNNSQRATPVKLKKPDRIPPVAALIKGLSHTDTTIVFRWQNSTSRDVVKTELYRIQGKQKIKLREFCFPDTISYYCDFMIQNGQSYAYELVVIDDDNNKTSTITNPLLFETGVRPKIKTMKAVANLEAKVIELSWEYPEKELYSFILYKSKGDLPFVIYKTLKPGQFTFIDKDLSVSNIYRYKIKAVFNSGAESIISDVVEVKY